MNLEVLLKQRSALLIAEDDPITLKALTTLLSRYVAHIDAATDGQEALDFFLRQPERYTMLLSDIQMPNLDGIALVRAIKGVRPKLPVAIISAHDDKEYLMASIGLRVDYYLLKPVRHEQLLSILYASLLDPEGGAQPFSFQGRSCALLLEHRRLHVGEEAILLTERESRFLHLLLTLKEKELHVSEMGLCLWGSASITPDTIHSFIKRLRKKLPPSLLLNPKPHSYRLNL